LETFSENSEKISVISKLIAASYLENKAIYRNSGHLPSMPRIESIISKLLEVIYPGFFDQGFDKEKPGVYVAVKEDIQWIYQRLTAQIKYALCKDMLVHDSKESTKRVENHAEQLCLDFLQKIPEVRIMLGYDIDAAFDGDPAARSTEEIVLAYPGVLAVSVYRISHELFQLQVPIIPRMMTEWAHRVTGIDIHPGARIGRRFFIDHGTGVVIGETTVIGDNVKLYQGVTLGALSFPKDEFGKMLREIDRHPKIGNGVTIYANATVLGGSTHIGDECVIGGSAFIIESVSASHTVNIEKPVLKMQAKPVRVLGI